MRRNRTSQGYPRFPKTLWEFQRRFSSEQACADYLIGVRWPEGFKCPYCKDKKAWRISVRSYRCRGCRREVHITARTVMHRSHLPLRYWFWAGYLMSTLTTGVSALQLKRLLGIGSYRSALHLCRRMRRAMVNPSREPLMGIVEVDDACIGGRTRGKHTRGRTKVRSLVAVAVENRGDHAGRVRLQVIPDVSALSLHRFILKNVARGSQINTDDLEGYKGIRRYGYNHQPRVQGPPVRGSEILPWVHRVIANLKTWLRGTHHRLRMKYLQEYLDEFTFRFNRRNYREHAFLSLLVLVKQAKPFQADRERLVASSA